MHRRPPGRSALRMLRSAWTGLAKNIVPKRENARSNSSSNVVCSTSATSKRTFGAPYSALADDRLDEPAGDQRLDRRADPAVHVRLAHDVRAPARPDHLDVVQQQPVDLDFRDRAPGEAHHHDPPALAQRAQAVGEAVAAD